MHIRRLVASAERDIALVATRMRETLVEVLGEERGAALYGMEWIRERVLFHLDAAKSTAVVLLAELEDGQIAGHTIVRREQEETGRVVGLFSTSFVARPYRRRGIAAAMLVAGEDWLRTHNLAAAVTYTSANNQPLIGLYRKHGYDVVDARADMVKLEKRLVGTGEPR